MSLPDGSRTFPEIPSLPGRSQCRDIKDRGDPNKKMLIGAGDRGSRDEQHDGHIRWMEAIVFTR